MARNLDDILFSSGVIPSIPAGEVRDVQAGLLLNGQAVAPHLVDVDGPCLVIAKHANGRFSVWNCSDAQLDDIPWKAKIALSMEQSPLVDGVADVVGGSVPAPTFGMTFLNLGDTPASYAGQAAALVQVNPGETGLQFLPLANVLEGIVYSWADAAERAAQVGMVDGELGVQRDTGDVYRYDDPPGAWSVFFNLQDGAVAPTFLSLGDTPGSYVGQGGLYPRVNVAETGLEFVAAPAPAFTSLPDTPANYVGAATYAVRVNAAATALEFVSPSTVTSLQGVFLITPTSTTPYPSITAAMAVAVPGDTVLVGPGTYAESFTIPSGVSLVSSGGPSTTTISGLAATGTRLTVSDDVRVKGFTIVLPTDVEAIFYNGVTKSYLEDVWLVGSGGTGVGVRSLGGYLECRNLQYLLGSCDIVFDIQGGFSIFWSSICEPGANANIGWRVQNAFLGLSGCGSFATIASSAIQVGANGNFLGGNVEIEQASVAFEVTSGSSFVRLRSYRAYNCTTDVLVQPAAINAQVNIMAAELSREKLSIPIGALSVVLQFFDERQGDQGVVIQGEFSVGSPGDGRESTFGEGDSYISGMVCLTNTNLEVGVWNDVTAILSSASGSTTALFPGVGINNAFYVGSDYPFPAIDSIITTAMVLGGGSIDVQYWDGAIWASIDIMAASGAFPLTQYANMIFERVASEENHFGLTPSWATKNLNGNTKYWIRFVITSGITTSPIGEQIKIHPNATRFGPDGTVLFYGTAQPQRKLFFHLNLKDNFVGGGAPGNSQIQFSTNITTSPTGNLFADNAADGFAGDVQIPEGLNTAMPIVMDILWLPKTNNAGTVRFSSRRAAINVGDLLNGTLPDILLVSDNAVPINSLNNLRKTTLTFTSPTSLPDSNLVVSLFRDATGGSPDTFVGDVAIVSVALYGYSWKQ